MDLNHVLSDPGLSGLRYLDPVVIRPKLGKEHSAGLRDINSPKEKTGGLNGDTRGAKKSLDTTRLQLLLDMMHKSNKRRVSKRCLI